MSETKNAVVTGRRTIDGVTYLNGAVITDMPANQFADLGPDGIGFVREATAKEVKAAPDGPLVETPVALIETAEAGSAA